MSKETLSKRGRPVNATLRSRKTQAILDAARCCFRRHGFHAATTASIAAEARISAGSLYQYFESKDDLIVAIVEEDLRNDLHAVSMIAGAKDFWSGIAEAISSFVSADIQPEKMRLWLEINAEATRNEVVREVVQRYESSLSRAFARVIESAQARNEIRADISPSHCATLLISLLDGLFSRAATGSLPQSDFLSRLPDQLRTLLAPQ